MDIDKIKKEYKKVKVSKMDISMDQTKILGDFIQRIKQQDRDDEKYILHNQIIPICIGLIILTVIIITVPVTTFPLRTGIILIYTGLISAVILLIKDYRDITKEPYDINLLAYLKQKERRLKSWYATPAKYYLTFTVFVSGLILMILGNTGIIRQFGIEITVSIIAIYLIILIISWVIGEYFYRQRHTKKHQPLIAEIRAQIKELIETINTV
jgi:hypothetical protein